MFFLQHSSKTKGREIFHKTAGMEKGGGSGHIYCAYIDIFAHFT